MKVTLIEVPYDPGHYGRRMGRGPLHLVQGGLVGADDAEHDPDGRGAAAALRLILALISAADEESGDG